MSRTLPGVGATPVAGVGTARWYAPSIPEFDREADDPERERERFESAREQAREAIGAERERAAERVGEDEAAILDAHRQFLDDPQIESSVETAVDEGKSAEAAVEAAFADPIDQFEATGGRTAERADDLRDVRDRLLRTLTGAESVALDALPEGTVVLADRLAPSDTARLDPDRVAGAATVRGGRTSHAAIVARALGLPAVVGVGEDLREVADGTTLVVDGDAGEVVVDPDEETREAATATRDVAVIEDPVATADGTPIEVAANVGTPAELDGAREHGADGIGLFRTEFLFFDRESAPDEDEQFDAYREALEAFPGGRVVVRTADVGGDKPVPYLDTAEESNPFLGERGIRRSLGPDAELFEVQLRALLRAAGTVRDDASDGDDETDRESGDGTNPQTGGRTEPTADAATGSTPVATGPAGAHGLAIMFPMVSDVAELDAAVEAVEGVADDLEDAGEPHAVPELGAMVETPAAASMADALAERVDFLSIGTNDLTQYVMAADRENERVAHLHDPLHPPVLCAIRETVEGGHAGDAWVGMCGEMAGNPELTELLVGLGLDELSASAVTVPQVKAAVRETDRDAASDLADRAIAAETRAAVHEVLGIEER